MGISINNLHISGSDYKIYYNTVLIETKARKIKDDVDETNDSLLYSDFTFSKYEFRQRASYTFCASG